jgi:hypothetical protein
VCIGLAIFSGTFTFLAAVASIGLGLMFIISAMGSAEILWYICCDRYDGRRRPGLWAGSLDYAVDQTLVEQTKDCKKIVPLPGRTSGLKVKELK